MMESTRKRRKKEKNQYLDEKLERIRDGEYSVWHNLLLLLSILVEIEFFNVLSFFGQMVSFNSLQS